MTFAATPPPGPATKPAGPAETGRRELAAAVVGCVVGGGVSLLAAGQAWVRFTVAEPGLPVLHGHASGHDVASLAAALAIAVLAGAAALPATRRWGRLAVAVLVTLAGVVVVAAVARAVADPTGQVAAEAARLAGHEGASPSGSRLTAWPWLSMAGGVVAALAGALAVWRGRRWPAMGRRYEPPRRDGGERGRHEGTDQLTGSALWDAIDRGEDPTG